MGTYDTFKTDSSLEEEGVWFTLSDGSRWKLRRASSKLSRSALKRAEAPYRVLVQRSQERGKDVPEAVADKINAQWMAQGLVVGFEGVTDENGEPLAYSPEAVVKLVTDLPELALEIIQLGTSFSQYQKSVEKDAEKNSSTG